MPAAGASRKTGLRLTKSRVVSLMTRRAYTSAVREPVVVLVVVDVMRVESPRQTCALELGAPTPAFLAPITRPPMDKFLPKTAREKHVSFDNESDGYSLLHAEPPSRFGRAPGRLRVAGA